MNPKLHAILHRVLVGSGLALWPQRVKSGLAQGARWTTYPFSSYWRGGHETELQAYLLNLGDITGWACWDLGAHFGLYSVGLARRVGPTGHVAAFEPNPVSFARLERHRRLNHLDWLRTFSVAASDSVRDDHLLATSAGDSTTTHLAYEGEDASLAEVSTTIRTAVLDDLVNQAEIRAPRLVKVDVEGHAHLALRGAIQTLTLARPLIVIGIHSPQERDGVLEAIQPLNYRVTRLSGESCSAADMIGADLVCTPI